MFGRAPHHHTCTIFLSFILIALSAVPLVAQETQAPQTLAEWQGWVSYNHQDEDCPHIYNGKERQCRWPSTLNLDIQQTTGFFRAEVELFAASWVTLPGNSKHWPQQVKIKKSGTQLVVVERQGRPSVWLGKGHHQISGRFAWSVMPKSLFISQDTGILHLQINGKSIQQPDRSTDGVIHLHDQQTKKETKTKDSLEVQVFRKISDSIPMLITTHIDLKVAGSNREISLGARIPDAQIPVSLHSKLPVRLDQSKQIRTQIRPGHFTITLVTRVDTPTTTLGLPESTRPWPTEEIWSFESHNEFRTVTIKNGVSIDPSQTSLPKNWHRLPTYLITHDTPLIIETRKRGNANPAPDNLALQRTIWLDEDGSHYTIKDQITGTMHNSWRLEMQQDSELGRVSLNNNDQLITKQNENGQAGVEVRHGTINLSAVSRIRASHLNITGWDHNFQSVQATLNLPPGWRLFATQGIDQASSWISKWTLLDLFLVLLIVLSASKLFDLPTAGITLITLTLIYHEPNAPRWIWPNLLITIGLIRVIPLGKLRKLMTLYLRVSLGVLLLIAIPFMVEQAHWSLHPQLGYHNDYGSASFENDYVGDATMDSSLPVTIMSRQSSPKKSYLHRDKGVARSSRFSQQYQLDPAANIQTGPGLPSWHWQTMRLNWNGPVMADQTMRLFLISPLLSRILGFARVLFLASLVLLFLRKHLKIPELDLSTGKTLATILMMTALLLPVKTQAAENIPSAQLLKEYETRLFSPPDCFPECGDIDSMAMSIQKENLNIDLQIHSYSDIFVPLPTSTLWKARTITIDGRPATIRTDGKDVVWLQCEEGLHTINMKGALPTNRDIAFSLPLRPHLVTFSGDGWEIDGVNQNHRPGQNIQLRKTIIKKDTPTATFESGSLPPQLIVERVLRFDMEWSMLTTVRRVSPTGSPILVKIPLLDFESVTTGALIKDNKIEATIPAKGNSFSWTSTLKKQQLLRLTAHTGQQWSEVWKLDISPMWHVETSGFPSTHNSNSNTSRQPTWHPWGGETIEIHITKPIAIQGKTFTIDASLLEITPGKRSTESTLTLQARSSRGGQHTLTLPPQSTLKSVRLNGRVEPIRMQGAEVMIPIHPGKQIIVVNWIHPNPMGIKYTTSALSIGIDSVNSEIKINVPRSRWVLFTGGPQTGPAILFWSEFLVILLISLGLGQISFTPLKSWQWMLLAGGLSQSGLIPTALVAVWLLALGARKKYGNELKGAMFNLQQCGIVLFTIIATVSLFYAVHNGLLGRPQMHIEGNGSSTFLLKWYQDRFSIYPQPWFISAPLLVFRLSMLAWALWLAFSVLGWLRWGWDCFATDHLWKEVKRIQFRKNKKTTKGQEDPKDVNHHKDHKPRS